MSTPLPEYSDPWRLADSNKIFSGRIALRDLLRLAEELSDVRGEADFSLEFGRDEHGRACVNGWVKATLMLQCQRCLEMFAFPVESRFVLAVVEGLDEARQLPERYEPLLLEEPRIRLRDLIEDELILAMPQVPVHANNGCSPCNDEGRSAVDDPGRTGDNPFAVLVELKRKSKSN